MRIEICNRPQRPVADLSPQLLTEGWGGQFFAETVHLEPGRYGIRVQVVFSDKAAGELMTVTARSLSTGTTLTSAQLNADPAHKELADEIYLVFTLSVAEDIIISGRVDANCATTLLRFITVIDAPNELIVPDDFVIDDPAAPSIRRLKQINLGTTGVCNASCIHCPTNKLSRRMPHGRMSMEVFTKFISELAEGGYTGEIQFGMFAEPFDDKFLVDRLKLIREKLPLTNITIATNGGLFDPKQHAEVIDLVDVIAVHVESVIPEIYDRIMDPLKSERVFPKIISLIELAQAKGRSVVNLTSPLHRENIAENEQIRSFFENAGFFSTEFTALSNRAWDGGPFWKMSLAPIGVACGTNQLHEYLFLDWDGAVLPCCFDFSKSMVLGNISNQSLAEIFAGQPWRDMYETFRQQKWSRKAACSRCRTDHDPTVRQMAQSIAAAIKPAATVYKPAAFAAGRAVRRESNGSLALSRDSTGCVIYGPYVRLAAGRYRLYPKLSVGADSAFPVTVFVDVCVGKVKQIAMRETAIAGEGPIETSLEFNLSQPDSRELIEFRVWTYGGLVAAFNGATLLRLEDERPDEVAPPLQRLIPASAFLFAAIGSRDADGSLTFAPGGIAGCAVYGPYVNLSSGRYQATPRIAARKGGVFPAHLLIDVCAGPTKQLASADVEVESTGEIDVHLEFDISTADEDQPVEFRVWTYGEVSFTFRGVNLVRLPNRMPFGGPASDHRAVSVTPNRRRGIFGRHRRQVG